MHRSQTKYLVSLVVLLTLLLGGCDALQNQEDDLLEASGSIEAREVAIAPEVSGKVIEVLVEEGQAVQEGDLLFRLEGELYQAQRASASAALDSAQAGVMSAQAALESAKAQFELALASALEAERPGRESAWSVDQPKDFDLPVWYFTQQEQMEAAEAGVGACQDTLDQAALVLSEVESSVGGERFLQAETRLARAHADYLVAKSVLDRAKETGKKSTLKEEAEKVFDRARDELDDAQQAYDDTLLSDSADDILEARARVLLARECFDTANDRVRALRSGEYSPTVAAAQKAVEQASAIVRQAEVAVDGARANLELLDAQIARLEVHAPIAGMVMTRSIEPGEVIQAGMSVMSVANLGQLTVTVYISEDRYGQVNLGQAATLQVDSFPGERFNATVTRIADRAEFTPRNVQTKEERQTTVYAIELAVANPDGKLKPGMPVDVQFE